MSVFGVRSECAETPKKIKKSEIAKKNLGRGDFGGSVGAQQTDKILRMALQNSLISCFNVSILLIFFD